MRKVLWGMGLGLPLLLGLSGLSAAPGSSAHTAPDRGWTKWGQTTWDWGRDASPPPVPADNPMSAAKVELGRRLFYDADLSINGTMSCATCHEQHHAFADGNRTHPGALDDAGRRNVPGLFNLAWLSPLTWADPRQTTLETQVAVPLFGDHPVEMAMAGKEDELARRLSRDPCYRKMFAKAFPAPSGSRTAANTVSYANVAKALAAFERSLVSRSSPWDRYRRGDADSLSDEAHQGLALFERHCASCHSGKDTTDAAFHRIASVSKDIGLAEITGKAGDDGSFRTPSLRNLGVTAPYLHDGSAPTLPAAIRAHQDFALMRDDEVNPLIALLGAMNDPDFLKNPLYSIPKKACGKLL